MNIYKGRGYVYGLQYHIVWCTKYRKKVLVGEVEKRLKELLRVQASTYDFGILAMETDEDHIHLLLECKPQHYIPELLKLLKGNSARTLFTEFPMLKNSLWGGHLWNPSYFICTVSEHTESQIKRYIGEQQTEPRKRGRPKTK
jgi:putative transposase